MVSRALQGVFNSLRTYHGAMAQKRSMDLLYGAFIEPGDLVFDVGAHVGDRISSFRRLGARVVGFEPQPTLHRVLRLIHGRDSNVTLRTDAVGSQRACETMRINTANPTVSTLSPDFVDRALGQDGWQDQSWDQIIVVNIVTLDDMIAQYGQPAFIKIDVEGFESAVLTGLSTAPKALSFEFTTISRDVSLSCLNRLQQLGGYAYNIALGETQQLSFKTWVDAKTMADHLINLPHAANSGDVYARLSDRG